MPLQTSELLQPIAADRPGGEDIRYDPLFEQIKQARTEEDELPTGDWSRQRKTADWPLVVKLSTQALTKRSKDLQIAAWLTEALLKREDFAGLRAGIELLNALLTDFWDHLHPTIEDDDLEFRASPLGWLGRYMAPAVRQAPLNASGHHLLDYRDARKLGYEADADTAETRRARQDYIDSGRPTQEAWDEAFDATPKSYYKALVADIDGCLVALEALEATGAGKFGGDAPHYAPLRDAILEVRQTAGQLLAKKLEREPDPVEEEPPPQFGTLEHRGGEADAPAVAAEAGALLSAVPRTRGDADARIAAAAQFLRQEHPTDPASYLLLRGYRWGELRGAGGTIDPKLLAAPPTELRSRLRTHLLDGRWPALLENAEQVMATAYGRGWLDLQRYVVAACAGLGSEYDYVSAAVQQSIRALLADLPELAVSTLMDDTPTANGETQAWLRDIGALRDGGAPTVAPHLPRQLAGRGAYERALEKVKAGAPEEAIELLFRAASQERSVRERFLRRTQAAGIMIDVGREAVALPILEELLREIEKHSLEEWEAGETVAQPMGLLYRCLQRTDGSSSTMEDLYLRICRLDPLQAMQLVRPPQ
jgi:type VI secretion system protein ImpA